MHVRNGFARQVVSDHTPRPERELHGRMNYTCLADQASKCAATKPTECMTLEPPLAACRTELFLPDRPPHEGHVRRSDGELEAGLDGRVLVAEECMWSPAVVTAPEREASGAGGLTIAAECSDSRPPVSCKRLFGQSATVGEFRDQRRSFGQGTH